MGADIINIKGYIPVSEARDVMNVTSIEHWIKKGALITKKIGRRRYVKFDDNLKRIIENSDSRIHKEINLKSGLTYYGSMGEYCISFNK